jgi:GNAT superfamily N-acetyltransferase
MDVFVAPEARRRGLGQTLVGFALSHPDLSLVYKWTLATHDAHGVYAHVGFHALPEPQRWMSLERPRAWTSGEV